MESTGPGFRVLQARDQDFFAHPRTVAYRVDPVSLDFTEVSGSAERLLGFAPEQWYRPGFWHARIHPEDQEAARAFFAAWCRERREDQLEYRVLDAAGQTVWVHQIIEFGRDADGQTATRGVLMDVTERLARETEVAKALILKAELLRILAEELAPPLRAISVYGEMLERHLSVQRDDLGSDYALGLRDGVQRLDKLLVQLMRAAQSGNMSLEEMSAFLSKVRGSASPD